MFGFPFRILNLPNATIQCGYSLPFGQCVSWLSNSIYEFISTYSIWLALFHTHCTEHMLSLDNEENLRISNFCLRTTPKRGNSRKMFTYQLEFWRKKKRMRKFQTDDWQLAQPLSFSSLLRNVKFFCCSLLLSESTDSISNSVTHKSQVTTRNAKLTNSIYRSLFVTIYFSFSFSVIFLVAGDEIPCFLLS